METVDVGIMIASLGAFLLICWVHKSRPEDNY